MSETIDGLRARLDSAHIHARGVAHAIYSTTNQIAFWALVIKFSAATAAVADANRALAEEESRIFGLRPSGEKETET